MVLDKALVFSGCFKNIRILIQSILSVQSVRLPLGFYNLLSSACVTYRTPYYTSGYQGLPIPLSWETEVWGVSIIVKICICSHTYLISVAYLRGVNIKNIKCPFWNVKCHFLSIIPFQNHHTFKNFLQFCKVSS